MSNNQEKLNEQLFNVVADEKVSDEARLKKVKYLVRLGADVNTRLYGKSILSKAIEQNAGAQVQNFLREKGAVEWVISKEEALEFSQGFWNDSGSLKSFDEIKSLLKKGADINAKNKDGETALMKMAKWGELELVKYLVENGADVHQKDKYDETALMKVARWGELELVKCLVENGADVHQKDNWGETVLVKAARWGHIEVVKFLAEHGADLDAKDESGRTVLMEVAEKGHLEVVKYLAEKGADMNAKDEWYGETALMKAARDGNLDMVKYLAESGADLDASDKFGKTVLDIAKNWKRYDCVMILEEAQKKNLSQKEQSAKTGVSLIVKKNEGR